MRTPSAALLAIAVAAPLAAAQQRTDRPPNVVVLLADDAGYADFGFQAQPDAKLGPLTPRIDSIAAGGARFTNAYVSGAVCSPTRAGLLTGRYQQRFGHERNIPAGYMGGGLPLGETTLADRLGALGHATALVGKWHLGYPDEYQPNRRGFDWFYGFLQGARSYQPIGDPSSHQVMQENGKALPEEGYVTDRLGAAAARFIEAHAGEPFFLYVAFSAVHGPLQPKAEDLAGLDGFRREQRRKYAALMKGLDRNVGVVLDALREHGLDEHTLVVFTNDNGGQTQTGANNAPLRGRKGQLWEGGIRVPLALRWPGVVAPGTHIDDPVIALDLLPTLVAAAGGDSDPAWKLDGTDLTPRLRGNVARLPERALFWRTQGSGGPIAMRRGQFKLVIERGATAGDDGEPVAAGAGAPGAGEESAAGENTAAERVHLFDLAADIAEAHDLAQAQPERVAAMLEELAQWESELIEPLWGARARRR